jgi:hypothetical protein
VGYTTDGEFVAAAQQLGVPLVTEDRAILPATQEPMNPTLKGVAYVSVWVLLWGTAASVADFVLLERGAYEAGTTGQGVTFAAYGIAAVVLAVRLAGRFLKSEP